MLLNFLNFNFRIVDFAKLSSSGTFRFVKEKKGENGNNKVGKKGKKRLVTSTDIPTDPDCMGDLSVDRRQSTYRGPDNQAGFSE